MGLFRRRRPVTHPVIYAPVTGPAEPPVPPAGRASASPPRPLRRGGYSGALPASAVGPPLKVPSGARRVVLPAGLLRGTEQVASAVIPPRPAVPPPPPPPVAGWPPEAERFWTGAF